nr:uncharacterized protein c4.02c [Quercus suber]
MHSAASRLAHRIATMNGQTGIRSPTALKRWSCQDRQPPSIEQGQDFLQNGGWWHNPRILAAVGQGRQIEETRAWSGCWNEKIVDLVRLSMEDDETVTILLTGRQEKGFDELIGTMLATKHLEFDIVALKPSVSPTGEVFSSTMNFKQAILRDITFTYRQAYELRLYEDRPKHTKAFREFFDQLNTSLMSASAPERPPLEVNVIQVSEQEINMDPISEVAEVQSMINDHNEAVRNGTAPDNAVPYIIKRSVFYTGYIISPADTEKLNSLVKLPANCSEKEVRQLANNILITPRPAPPSILSRVGGMGAHARWKVTGLAHVEHRVWAARVACITPGRDIYTENKTPCVVLATRRAAKPMEASRIQHWQPVGAAHAFEFDSTVGEKVLLRIEQERPDEDPYEATFPSARNARKHPREDDFPPLQPPARGPPPPVKPQALPPSIPQQPQQQQQQRGNSGRENRKSGSGGDSSVCRRRAGLRIVARVSAVQGPGKCPADGAERRWRDVRRSPRPVGGGAVDLGFIAGVASTGASDDDGRGAGSVGFSCGGGGRLARSRDPLVDRLLGRRPRLSSLRSSGSRVLRQAEPHRPPVTDWNCSVRRAQDSSQLLYLAPTDPVAPASSPVAPSALRRLIVRSRWCSMTRRFLKYVTYRPVPRTSAKPREADHLCKRSISQRTEADGGQGGTYPAAGTVGGEGGELGATGTAGLVVLLDAVDDGVGVEAAEEGVASFPAGGASGAVGGDVATILGGGGSSDGGDGGRGGGGREPTHGGGGRMEGCTGRWRDCEGDDVERGGSLRGGRGDGSLLTVYSMIPKVGRPKLLPYRTVLDVPFLLLVHVTSPVRRTTLPKAWRGLGGAGLGQRSCMLVAASASHASLPSIRKCRYVPTSNELGGEQPPSALRQGHRPEVVDQPTVLTVWNHLRQVIEASTRDPGQHERRPSRLSAALDRLSTVPTYLTCAYCKTHLNTKVPSNRLPTYLTLSLPRTLTRPPVVHRPSRHPFTPDSRTTTQHTRASTRVSPPPPPPSSSSHLIPLSSPPLPRIPLPSLRLPLPPPPPSPALLVAGACALSRLFPACHSPVSL